VAAETPPPLIGAVEGAVDEEVLRRLAAEVGAELADVVGLQGKGYLLQHLRGYNQAAQRTPWVVLVDLDRDAECAAAARERWLPDPAPQMCFRVDVQAVEAWLLADREKLAGFLGVSAALVPKQPEALADPKRKVVGLARRSRKRAIREGMVPEPKSGQATGPEYARLLMGFVAKDWRPAVAARNADSLRRCRERMQELVGGAT
jgi:hypothetical protein